MSNGLLILKLQVNVAVAPVDLYFDFGLASWWVLLISSKLPTQLVELVHVPKCILYDRHLLFCHICGAGVSSV